MGCMCVGNKIGDAGAAALADALKSNNTLTAVYLYGAARQLPRCAISGVHIHPHFGCALPRI